MSSNTMYSLRGQVLTLRQCGSNGTAKGSSCPEGGHVDTPSVVTRMQGPRKADSERPGPVASGTWTMMERTACYTLPGHRAKTVTCSWAWMECPGRVGFNNQSTCMRFVSRHLLCLRLLQGSPNTGVTHAGHARTNSAGPARIIQSSAQVLRAGKDRYPCQQW